MDNPLRLKEKLYILGQIPLFANLTVKDKEFIARASQIIENKKGDIIYREKQAPDAFYCVITGRIRIYIKRDGREEDLEYLKRGRYFGILSLLTKEPHSVTAQAVNDSIILKIVLGDFEKILRRIPELAIHFSQTLSRRLKRKDLHEKRVFESTILSIFGSSDRIGVTNYVINLGISLAAETKKKVIVVEVSKDDFGVSASLGLKDAPRPAALSSPFFEEGMVEKDIYSCSRGIDVMNVLNKGGDTGHIVPLLSYLTNDYHYILVDLPSRLDETAYLSLKQADIVHLITASDAESLKSTERLITELNKTPEDLARKIKVVTTEYGSASLADFITRRAILKHDIYAALPDLAKSKENIGPAKSPIIAHCPNCEYSRTIRRISRDIGDCLVGLALGAGAALGLAHIGVLRILERERIPVDILAGTSMGALVGALWASGRNADQIEEIVLEFRSKIRTLRLLDLAIPRTGLIKGREVRRFLVRKFGNMTFYDLKLPFKVVACDIEKREEVVLDKGGIVDAVMASVSIPGVFEPVDIDGRMLVDGGIINPLPTNVLMRSGVSKIVSVNTLPSPDDVQRSKKKVANIFDIIVNSVQASEYLLAEMSCQDVDVAMHPVLSTADWYEFYKASSVIRRGEEEALKFLPQLRELAQS